MRDPVQHILELSERAMAREPKALPLPPWSDARRAAPAAAFRSALFPATPRKTREMVKNLEIYSIGNVMVRFTGERFDQTDLTVYLEVLHRMRNSTEAEFTAYDMLKSLGKPDNGTHYAWLDDVLQRLVSGTVSIETAELRYSGHLIEGVWEQRTTRRYALSINPRFSRAFHASWSSLDISQRRALGTPTAMALHAYYSSHRAPGRHLRTTLCEIARLSGKNRYQTLRRGLNELVDVGFLKSWNEDGDGGISVRILHPDTSHSVNV